MQKTIGIIDMWSTWVGHIKKHIQEQGFIAKVITYTPQIDFLTQNTDNLSWIIISGSSLFPTISSIEELIPQFELLKDTHVPILGICLWHQIISLLYWGNLVKEEMINFLEKIHIICDNSIFLKIPDNSLFQEEHAKRASIPENFLHIASSSSSKNEAMKHKEKDIFWVQFHPEVSEKWSTLFQNFLHFCKS